MELVLDRVSKQYDSKIAVDRVSLRLRPGVYGLLGANGAGKTTLLRMICGVLRPTSGHISLGGVDVSHEEYRDRLGYLPQQFGYYPEFSARDFMLYLACVKGLNQRQAVLRTRQLLETVALADVAHKKVKTFSGGMRQRLGIAQALLNDPALLVLDEPTAGLDPKERVRFRSLITQLGCKKIVLLSTHIVSDVEHAANNILVLKNGSLLQSGSLAQVLQPLEGCVYECAVTPREVQALAQQGCLLSLHETPTGAVVRVAAKQPPCAGAVPVGATLEDLYLYYFQGTGANERCV